MAGGGPGGRVKPTFIGLGAQKCASSWLHSIFDDHPQAFVSTPKEINFFSAFYERGYDWYERHFIGGEGRAAVGEISPSYLPDSDAPLRARAYNEDFRILVALRDPVERAYSNHLHDIRLGYCASTDSSFEAGLARNPMYVEQSRYARHLRAWLRQFPRERVMVVLQEDIAVDALAEARRVYEFLGIGADHVSSAVGQRTNESYLPKSQRREDLIRAGGRVLRAAGLTRMVDALHRANVVAALHRGNRQDIRALVPPMRVETREALWREFGPDTIELARLLGRESLPWQTWRRATGSDASSARGGDQVNAESRAASR